GLQIPVFEFEDEVGSDIYWMVRFGTLGPDTRPAYPHFVIAGGRARVVPDVVISGGARSAQIPSNDGCRFPLCGDAALVQPDCPIAQALYRHQVVADEQHGPSLTGHLLHLTETLPLKCGVPDGKDFVDDEYVRLEV